MKKLLLFLTLLASASCLLAANTAKALQCGANGETVYLVYDGTTYSAGGTYSGESIYYVQEFDNSDYFPLYRSNVKKVVITSSFASYTPKSCAKWFQNMNNLTTIEGWENLNTSNVTDMSNMFYDCDRLTSLDVSNFDTSNVTNMSQMFRSCSSLTSLDLSSFNTGNVTNMAQMFRSCWSLTSLDLSSFNTSNVTDMSDMFYYCRSLTSLDLSKFDTSNVTDMAQMFRSCWSLTSLDLSNFNTSNVTDMSDMFYDCRSLTSLDLSSFNTSNVTNMSDMFYYCSSLTSLDLSNFNTSKGATVDGMFRGCSNLTEITGISKLVNSNVTSIYGVFDGCSKLETLDLSGWDTGSVTNMYYTFQNCVNLREINGLLDWDISKVDSWYRTFKGDNKLPENITFTEFFTWFKTSIKGKSSDIIGMEDIAPFHLAAGFDISVLKPEGVYLNPYEFFADIDVTGLDFRKSKMDFAALFDPEGSPGRMFSNATCNGTLDLSEQSEYFSKVDDVSYMFSYFEGKKIVLPTDYGKSAKDWNSWLFNAYINDVNFENVNFEEARKHDYVADADYSSGTYAMLAVNYLGDSNLDFSKLNLEGMSLYGLFAGVTEYGYLFKDDDYNDRILRINLNTAGVKAIRELFHYYDFDYYRNLKIVFGDKFTCSGMESIDNQFLFNKDPYLNNLEYENGSPVEIELPDNFGPDLKSAKGLFKDLVTLEKIVIGKNFAPEATDISSLFENCAYLREITFGDGFAPKAEDMSGMFKNCWQLNNLSLPSGFGQSATDISEMFYNYGVGVTAYEIYDNDAPHIFAKNCPVRRLDLSNLDTRKVQKMQRMFAFEIDKDAQPYTAVTKMEGYFSQAELFPIVYGIKFGPNFQTQNLTGTDPVADMFKGRDDELKWIDFYDSDDTELFPDNETTRFFYDIGINDEAKEFANEKTEGKSASFPFAGFNYVSNTLIYLPKGQNNWRMPDDLGATWSSKDDTFFPKYFFYEYWAKQGQVSSIYPNLVYDRTGEGDLHCGWYYHSDESGTGDYERSTEIPRGFSAYYAEYYQGMKNRFGADILPFKLTVKDNGWDDIGQAYWGHEPANNCQPFILTEENNTTMFFKGCGEIPANTPFLFKHRGNEDGDIRLEAHFEAKNVDVEATTDISNMKRDGGCNLEGWDTQGFYHAMTLAYNSDKDAFALPKKDSYVSDVEFESVVNDQLVEDDPDNDIYNEYYFSYLRGYEHGKDYVWVPRKRVYYIANNKFYRASKSDLTVKANRALFIGMWDKNNDAYMASKQFDIMDDLPDEETITGIKELKPATNGETTIKEVYDMQGRRQQGMQKGMNIVRMSDGTIKKVMNK